ncbi:hypothetical protein HGRIS_005551 [Hohenbuehelia grisea]|uniref:Uncharacterized protein n=1 Tax=Hohenbuehelia grisea TaxID=104357 RepID=A0ABR3JX63_9AGAR
MSPFLYDTRSMLPSPSCDPLDVRDMACFQSEAFNRPIHAFTLTLSASQHMRTSNSIDTLKLALLYMHDFRGCKISRVCAPPSSRVELFLHQLFPINPDSIFLMPFCSTLTWK